MTNEKKRHHPLYNLEFKRDATKKNLDQYLVTVYEIERVTGETKPIADYAKPSI